MMKPEALLWKASQNMRTEVMSSFLLRSFCLYVVNVNSCQPHGCKKCFSIFKFGDLCHCCFYYVEFASAWRRLLGRSSMKLAVTMAYCMYVWNFLNFGRCENSQKKKKKKFFGRSRPCTEKRLQILGTLFVCYSQFSLASCNQIWTPYHSFIYFFRLL